MADWMCCSACDGHGRVSLQEVKPFHAEMLEWLREDKPEGATALEASEVFTLESGYEACHEKRFKKLHKWGFVDRRKVDGCWVYRAVAAQTPAAGGME